MADQVLSKLADSVLIPPFSGLTPPAWFLRAVEGGLAGVTLFASNTAAGPSALASLTSSLRSAADDVLVAIDEEGGDVTRVGYHSGSQYPGNAALGAVDDVSVTEQVYAAMGRDLAALGVNLDLAPCLDVLSAPLNPVIGTRSFGSSPSLVARHGAAAVRGLQSAGVGACAKHFPGHGSTILDSHEELAVVDGSMSDVEARDLPPFRAALAAGVLTVMPGHLRVPGLTGALPASLSADAMSLLRGPLGFTGAVVTDGLEMRAVSDPYGLPGASVLALAAGCDLLCLGRDVDEDGYVAVRSAIARAVRSGTLPGERLEDAAARVGALRAALRELRGPGAGGAPETEAVPGLEAARRAVRLTGSRPVLAQPVLAQPVLAQPVLAEPVLAEPVLAEPVLAEPVVIEVEPVLNMAAGEAHWGLTGYVRSVDLRRVAAGDPSAVDGALKAALGRPLVVAFRDAHRSPATQSFVGAVLAARPDAVLLEMGLPYWMPPAGSYQAHLATYGASRASTEAVAELLGLTQVTAG